MDLHPDFKDLLAEFARAEVEYALLGGYAVGYTDAALRRAERAQLADLDVPVLSLADLLANKRASGRPQDLADVALLERAAKR